MWHDMHVYKILTMEQDFHSVHRWHACVTKQTWPIHILKVPLTYVREHYIMLPNSIVVETLNPFHQQIWCNNEGNY